ncbi:MAG: PEP/pyruvate-binding domain-containing protein [Anaerolineae bacterium]|nr:PEP/pyruvate-binding domain-containing protein [Anaerolineae bacterium]
MTFVNSPSDRLLGIYLALGQYPILRSRIRNRMLERLFDKGIITPESFEAEVREKAVRSQKREGMLASSQAEELPEVWELRLGRIRYHVIELMFSEYFSFKEFEDIVNEILSERGITKNDLRLAINPELAPLELVFEQAMTIEKLPPLERKQYEARLLESKVVIIRSMISDQLRYINVAKDWFTLSDLAEIKRRIIGSGRIGGKAAGMLLAARIIRETGSETLRSSIRVPESFYVGSNEIYTFMSINNLIHWNDQKYKSEGDMRDEYPTIIEEFLKGEYPPGSIEKFQSMLAMVGCRPLIVRSSSLLEDNFGMAFAGKYESIFLPNQGSLKDNLRELKKALALVYASTLNPAALLYRRRRGLQDYDERMAILIQVVEGENYNKYYLPHGAGVAFSRNLYRWAPQIRSEEGFVRLVWGLGTRAVDRVGNDYPRLIALSHPLLRPSSEPKAVRRYSQQFVDLIDLEKNELVTLPIHDVLDSRYPPLRYLVQVDEDGYFTPLRINLSGSDNRRLVLNYDEMLKRTAFAKHMKEILSTLEKYYRGPVDVEFTIRIKNPEAIQPQVIITLLQCRPQSHLAASEKINLPAGLGAQDIVFSTQFVVPRGFIERIDYVLFVPPEGYFALPTNADRVKLARAIGELNNNLTRESFICTGPGRWGSSNSDLGVPIDYSDIYNTRALVELAGQGVGPEPEPSLGTHFFQDLLESQIYPLAIYLDADTTVFNRKFFYDTPNRLDEFVKNVDESLLSCLKLIRVSDFAPDRYMQVVMDDEKNQAVAFLKDENI